MIQNAVYFALSRAVEAAGDDQTACEHLKRLDPLLRRAARRRIRRVFREALLATRQPSHEPEGARHIARLAYLIAARALPPDAPVDDIHDIESRYEQARAAAPPAPGRFWWLSLLLLLLLLAGGWGGALALSSFFSAPERRDALARPAPPPKGAFARGGSPRAGEDALSEALTSALPRYLIALDRWAEVARQGASQSRIASLEEALKKARQDLLADQKLQKGLGEAGLLRLKDVFARAEEAALAPTAGVEEASDALLEAVGTFNDEMASQDLPYFLDGDVITDLRTDRRLVVLYSFLVENVTLFQSGEARVRALHLQRLDQLNVVRTLLGFTRPQHREALILLDQVEDLLVTYILPALAPDASVPLVGEKEAAFPIPWKEEVERKAGELVRAEYGRLLDAEASREVGQKLLRRRALFEGWQKALERRGMVLMLPTTLDGDDYDYQNDLAGLVPEEELAEFLALSQELAGPSSKEVLKKARQTLIASVERHEVQHRLDYAGAPLPLPAALEEYVGAATSATGEENRFATQAKYELSAYLSELGRDPETTRVNLTLLARFLFNRDLWGTAECYAALVIFAELGLAFGLDAQKLVEGGIIHRARLAEIYLTLADLPPEQLRDAAKGAWERLFGRPLPPLEKVSP